MKGIREKQKENFANLLREIEKCESEEDIDRVDTLAEEMVQGGHITKKAYRFIEEAMDDRIMDFVEREFHKK